LNKLVIGEIDEVEVEVVVVVVVGDNDDIGVVFIAALEMVFPLKFELEIEDAAISYVFLLSRELVLDLLKIEEGDIVGFY
jgi:hypothetical protein